MLPPDPPYKRRPKPKPTHGVGGGVVSGGYSPGARGGEALPPNRVSAIAALLETKRKLMGR